MSEITIELPLGKEKWNTDQGIKYRAYHRVRMFAITFLSDFIALILSTTLVHVSIYRTLHFDYVSMGEFEHILFTIVCISLLMTTKLYPGIGLNPTLEIKTVTQLAVTSFLIVFSFLMIRIPLWTQEKLVLILVSGLSIITILSMRWLIRILTTQLDLWGEPVVVVADREKMENMVAYFHERRRLGFVPVLGVADQVDRQVPSNVKRMEVDDLLRLSNEHFSRNGIQTVLVSTQIASDPSRSKINQDLLRKFERIIFVSDMDWLEGVSIAYHDFEGLLGMEAQRNFLTPLNEILKRMMDILFSITLGILSLPVLALTALMIRLDSPGPVLYKQQRVGKDGREIAIFKFRSMQVDAEKFLTEYFEKNPLARQEWDKTQKLREDPRITRVGKWIRKFSVDELPQLLNILKGDMSVVGPRPIMPQQETIYGNGIEVYRSVRPGLTGFWQVSGRNRTSFFQRAIYDVYYVRNWSVWLDIYIILRTIWVVLSRDGAY